MISKAEMSRMYVREQFLFRGLESEVTAPTIGIYFGLPREIHLGEGRVVPLNRCDPIVLIPRHLAPGRNRDSTLIDATLPGSDVHFRVPSSAIDVPLRDHKNPLSIKYCRIHQGFVVVFWGSGVRTSHYNGSPLPVQWPISVFCSGSNQGIIRAPALFYPGALMGVDQLVSDMPDCYVRHLENPDFQFRVKRTDLIVVDPNLVVQPSPIESTGLFKRYVGNRAVVEFPDTDPFCLNPGDVVVQAAGPPLPGYTLVHPCSDVVNSLFMVYPGVHRVATSSLIPVDKKMRTRRRIIEADFRRIHPKGGSSR